LESAKTRTTTTTKITTTTAAAAAAAAAITTTTIDPSIIIDPPITTTAPPALLRPDLVPLILHHTSTTFLPTLYPLSNSWIQYLKGLLIALISAVKVLCCKLMPSIVL
jgi:hypothetical protein